jgi:hypothetical protein
LGSPMAVATCGKLCLSAAFLPARRIARRHRTGQREPKGR